MISQLRDYVADLLETLDCELHRYVPEDVALLPCIVVGRPALYPSEFGFSAEMTVTVIGHRAIAYDTQELDVLTEDVVERLTDEMPLTSVQPGVTSIGENTYPVYDCVVTPAVRVC